MGSDYFYAIGIEIDKNQEKKLKESRNWLENLLKTLSFDIDSGFFFIPFWYDEEKGSALDFPIRKIKIVLKVLDKINEIKEHFEINSIPIILSGYEGIIDGIDEFILGYAYPLKEDINILSLLKESLEGFKELLTFKIEREIKTNEVKLELLGEINKFYLFKSTFKDLYKPFEEQKFFLLTCRINPGISASEFIEIYQSALDTFKNILKSLFLKFNVRKINMIFWSDLVTEIISDWPEHFDTIGEIATNKSDKDIISELKNTYKIKLNKYSIEIKNGRVTFLTLQNNNLSEVPKIVFSLNELSNLNLMNNKLSKIPIKIANLKKLEVLSLDSNNFQEIPESIYHLRNLKSLYLANNNLKEIPNLLGNMESLTTLSLENNEIEEIPAALGRLKNLKSLYLSKNPIKIIHDNVFKAAKLENLYLKEVNLKRIPDQIGALKNLKKLYISNKQLSKVDFPEEIENLKELTHLSLNNLALEEFPKFISHINNLEFLDLSNNKLREIPDFIGTLAKLKELNLANNMIVSVPESIGNLVNLEKLYLNNNNIKKIPDSIKNCSKLKIFKINDNPCADLIETYPAILEKQINIYRIKNEFIKKIIGREIENYEDFVKIFAECIAEKEGHFFEINNKGWHLLEKGFWEISYYIGKEIIKASKTTAKRNGEVNKVCLGYGLDLTAASLINSEKIEDIKEAIKLFEQARDLSPNLYSPEYYQQALKKYDQMTKKRIYLLILNDLIENKKNNNIFGIYYRFPFELEISEDVILERLEIKEDIKEIIINETSFIFLEKLNGNYLYLVKFQPEKFKLNLNPCFDLIERILALSIEEKDFLDVYDTLIDDFKKIFSKLSLSFDHNLIDFVGFQGNDHFGGILWPNIKSQSSLRIKNHINLINYYGIPIYHNNFKFLIDIEKYLGKRLEFFEDFTNKYLGFYAEKGKIKKIKLENGDFNKPLPESIKELNNLESLNLNENKFNKIPEIVAELTQLKELSISYNNIDSLPNFLFSLKNLEKLNISYNPLYELPEEIGNLKNLKALKIQNIKIKKLPPSLKNLKNLIELDLYINEIQELPEFIGEFENLKILNIKMNPISSLPNSFEKLTSLEILKIRSPNLKLIPKVIWKLKSLKQLELDEFNNRTIPNDISNLSNLEHLEISCSKLTNIPDVIGTLKNLITLNFRENNIKSISPKIESLKKLEKLILNYNKLTTFPIVLLKLKNLKVLELIENKITSLPKNIGDMESLEILDLGENKLKSLPSSIKNLKNLKKLYLYENNLSTIPEELSELKNLEVLDLRFMKIKNPEIIKEKMKFVKKLSIDD
ncbi:MAG: leucine-rich repeat domain-containing protein [Promethearchaeota archaeon]